MLRGRKPALFSTILGWEKKNVRVSISDFFWSENLLLTCCHVIDSDTLPFETMLQWSRYSYGGTLTAWELEVWVLLALCPNPRAVPGTWWVANTYYGMNDWRGVGKTPLTGCEVQQGDTCEESSIGLGGVHLSIRWRDRMLMERQITEVTVLMSRILFFKKLSLKIQFILNFKNWSVVDLQFHASFRHIA